MNRRARLAFACALLLPAALPDLAHAAGQTHTVLIDGMRFKPAVVEAKVGDTIVWQNKDIVPHTVTAGAQHIESGSIAMNQTWSYKVKNPGRIDYVCRFHPVMQGQVVVSK